MLGLVWLGFFEKKKKTLLFECSVSLTLSFPFLFFNKVYFYLMYLSIFPACMSVYQLHGTMETRGC